VDLSQSHALPYIAGFFDGEGSIGIYLNGKKQGRTLRVQHTLRQIVNVKGD
jgi:DNA transposition AAA+ family ATPase